MSNLLGGINGPITEIFPASSQPYPDGRFLQRFTITWFGSPRTVSADAAIVKNLNIGDEVLVDWNQDNNGFVTPFWTVYKKKDLRMVGNFYQVI